MVDRVMGVASSEEELLCACREGEDCAVDRLIDMHLAAGVAMARRLAPTELSNEEILDFVHDAFVTAFDEALEDDVESLRFVYHRLLRAFLERDGEASDHIAPLRSISAAEMRELRLELVRELRMIVAIHAESPKARSLARQMLLELRSFQRRLRARFVALRSHWPAITVSVDH